MTAIKTNLILSIMRERIRRELETLVYEKLHHPRNPSFNGDVKVTLDAIIEHIAYASEKLSEPTK